MKKIIKSFFAIAFATFLGMVALSTQAAVEIETKGPVYDYDHTILKEGVLYQTYLNKPKKGEFKKCEIFKYGEAKNRYFKVKQCGNNISYDEKPTFAYSIYYMGLVSLPYFSETVGYFPAGSTRHFSVQKQEATTFQASLSTTLSSSFTTSVKQSASIDFLKLDSSISSTVSASISSQISITDYYSITESEGYDIPIAEAGYYLKQRRGTFKAYLVEEYEFSWNSIVKDTKQHWFHTDYYYDLINTPYTLTNISMVYSLETDLGGDFVKYDLDKDGKLVYAGHKEQDNILYI